MADTLKKLSHLLRTGRYQRYLMAHDVRYHPESNYNGDGAFDPTEVRPDFDPNQPDRDPHLGKGKS
jgi:hypothetical protein